MVENEANVVVMLQMKSNSRNLKKMVIPNNWGAKIDILEKKKLHKQQLLEEN